MSQVDDDDGDGIPGRFPVVYDSWGCGEHPDFPAYIEGLRPKPGPPVISEAMMKKGLSVKANRILADACQRSGKSINDLTDEDISKARDCAGYILVEIRKFITACRNNHQALNGTSPASPASGSRPA